VLSATGNGLAYENMNPIVVTGLVMAVIVAVAYWQRAWLSEMVQSDDIVSFIKGRWSLSWAASLMLLAGVLIAGVLLYLLATVEPIQQ
jgi:uncharacterized membrane protein